MASGDKERKEKKEKGQRDLDRVPTYYSGDLPRQEAPSPGPSSSRPEASGELCGKRYSSAHTGPSLRRLTLAPHSGGSLVPFELGPQGKVGRTGGKISLNGKKILKIGIPIRNSCQELKNC